MMYRPIFLLLAFALATLTAHAQFIEKEISGGVAHKNIYFYNSQLGFLGGENIFRTEDGGESWTEVKYHGIDSIMLNTQSDHQFHFFNASHGIAVATSLFDNAGTVMETTDGGINWKIIFKDSPLNTWPYVGYTDVHFFDSQSGFAVGGNGRRIVTIDGGKTWTRRDLPIKANFYDIFFINETTGYVSGNEYILKTLDGGNTWTANHLGYYDEIFNSIAFTSLQTGFLVTDDGRIYTTKDQGASWSLYPFNSSSYLTRIFFVDSNVGYIAGSNSNGHNILKTTDGGATWEELDQTFSKSLHDIYFLDSNIGYVCGYNYPNKPYFGKTTNGTGNTIPRALFDVAYPTNYIFCPGNTVDFLNKGNTTYIHKWYINNQFVSSSYNLSFQFNDPGDYEIKLITNNGSKSAERRQSITVQDPEKYKFEPIQLLYAKPGCEGSPFYFSIDNQSDYTHYELWQDGKLQTTLSGGRLQLDVLNTDVGSKGLTSTFTIKTKRDFYCYREKQDTTLTISVVPQNYELNVEMPFDDTVCEGAGLSVEINNTIPDVSYFWRNPDNLYGTIQEGNGGKITLQVPGNVSGNFFSVGAFSYCGTIESAHPFKRGYTTANFAVDYLQFKDKSPAFTNTSQATMFSWDLGDGAVPRYSTDALPTGITYSTYGEKKIKLTTDEGHGCTAQRDTVIFVSDRIVPKGGVVCSENILSSAEPYEYIVESHSDKEGNLIVTGYTLYNFSGSTPATLNLFLKKYDKDGILSWSKKGSSIWFSEYETLGIVPRGISLDDGGNIYLAIDFDLPNIVIDNLVIGNNIGFKKGSFQAAVIKFSSDGQIRWTNQFYDSDPYRRNNVRLSDIEINSKGEIFYNMNFYFSNQHETKVVFKDGDGIITQFQSYNTIMKINSEGKLIKRFDYAVPQIYENVVYQSPFKTFGYTSLQDPQPEGPKIKFDELDQLILTAYIGNSYGTPMKFGDISLGFDNNALVVAVLKGDSWTAARQLSSSIGFFPEYPHIDDVQATKGSIYLSYHFDDHKYDKFTGQQYAMVVNGDSLKFGETNSFILQSNYDGDINWSQYHKDVIFSSLIIDSLGGNFSAIGTCNKVGILNSTTQPRSFKSTGARDGFVAEFDAMGYVRTVSTFGTDDDEYNNQLASVSCGQMKLIGYVGHQLVVKTLSLTNSCGQKPPELLAMPENDLTICKEGSGVALHVVGATNYRWLPTTGLTNPTSGETSAIPAETTTYTVFGYDVPGCYASKKIKINVQDATHDFTYEVKDLHIKVATPQMVGESYTWSFGGGIDGNGSQGEYDFSESGTYDVCLYVNNVCSEETGVPLQFCKTITATCNEPQVNGFSYTTDSNYKFNFNPAGQNAIRWDWDFGDGDFSQDAQSSHSYADVGTYKVCVKAYSTCADSEPYCKDVVVICPSIIANVTYSTVGYRVIFSNQSTNANAWEWDFGDGTISTLQNPQHQYNNAGSYDVCVTSKNTCNTLKYCFKIVLTCQLPITAAFTYTATESKVTFQTNATNTSSYLWDFGNGFISTDEDPIYTYPASGNFNVCLKATGICDEKTICKLIAICPEKDATFRYIVNNNEVKFTSYANYAATVTWTFGDGMSSFDTNPVHNYKTTSGTYTVCQQVKSTCVDKSNCFPIAIDCPASSPDFSYVLKNSTVTFQNQSLNAETNLWDFGDGQKTNEVSPVHQYIGDGTYSVCLNTYNKCGAFERMCKSVTFITTGMENETQNDIEVFPTPFEDYFMVNIRDVLNVENLQIINMQGIILFNLAKFEIKSTNQISFIDKPAGPYYVRVLNKNSSYSKLIIKVR